MRQTGFAIWAIICILFFSCSDKDMPHRGVRKDHEINEKWDTVEIRTDSLPISWNGNPFYSMGRLCYADMYYCHILQFDIKSGDFICKSLGKGHANSEIPDFMYAYPVKNNDEKICIVNSSLYMYVYNNKTSEIEKKGKIDFGWSNVKSDDYASPSLYSVMELSDFGVDIYERENQNLIFPVNVVDRNALNPHERFEKGRIWAEMNYEDFHIGCLYGKFPPIYRKTPSPGFDYFQYAMNDGLFYANHAIDSLIYVCSDQGEPLFSFGFDSPMADRSYSVSKEHFDESTFEKDAKHVSFNTGLDYIPETEQIIRTICFDPKEPKTCIQIYDGKAFDLIYETHVDGIYKYLTYQEGKYIGTSLYQDEKSSIYYLTIK